MKRFFGLSTLAGAVVAILLATSPVAPQAAHGGQILGRVLNDINYYSGGNAPVYNGYSGYGYSQYGNGYTYYAPRAYAYPSYRSYGYSQNYGYQGEAINGGGYGYHHRYHGDSHAYRQAYRPAYSPYGYGGYGPYGY